VIRPYFWSHWLADALRSDPFIAPRVVEVPGWRERGRPPAEFSYLPSGVLCHHTACMIRRGHDPQSCINSIIAGNSVAPGPISQLLGTWTPPGVRWTGTNPDPRIVVLAAGRSNHAGSGVYPWGAPSGNGSSIGIEWCGPPEVGAWPDVVVELYERVAAALLRWNGWQVGQVTTHWEYAVPRGRKIDQSGPHPGEPQLRPLQPWNPDRWRAQIAARLAPLPPPPPPILKGSTMLIVARNKATGVYHVADGIQRRNLGSNPDAMIWATVLGGQPMRDAASGREVQRRDDISDVDATFIEQLGVVAR
jgi:hypothetical protein